MDISTHRKHPHNESLCESSLRLTTDIVARHLGNRLMPRALKLTHIATTCCLLLVSGCTSTAIQNKCAKLTKTIRDLGTCKRIEEGQLASTTLDCEPGHFRVRSCSNLTIGVSKKALPLDLLAYGLNHIIGIQNSYAYYPRIIEATRTGIAQSGCGYIDTFENGQFHAAMISLSTKNVVMFRYMGPNAMVHYDSGEDIDIVEGRDHAK